MEAEMMLEAPETGAEEIEQPDVETEGAEGEVEQQQTEQPEDPYSPKSSKEYSNWLKGIRDIDPANAKFARMAKDDHSRLFQLHQLEPKGIDGIREKYALMDSVMHGELKGHEAIGAMQDELRILGETDAKLAAGDPSALDDLGEQFLPGLAKMLPHIMERVEKHDPEAFAEAMGSRHSGFLAGSPAMQSHNALVDLWNEKVPTWLPEDKIVAWHHDKLQRMGAILQQNGEWLAKQMEGQKPGQQQSPTAKQENQPDERTALEQEKQEWHWKTKINPGLDKHAESAFAEQFKPYAKRLKLDANAEKALGSEFINRVVKKAAANPVYSSQIARYRKTSNPDPTTVLNFAKVEFNKHAKSVMDGLVDERYKSFLNGKPKPAPSAANPGSQQRGPVEPNVEIRSVKPPQNEIDFKGTPREWLHQKKYKLFSGKVVQVRQ